MRSRATLAALALVAGLSSSAAGSKVPTESLIIGMAQHFVLEHFKREPQDFFDVAFDIVKVHPQPGGGYWAVIGGFMADSGNKTYRPHAYGVAIRLVCEDAEAIACWRLEKMVIDRTVILNN